MDAIKPERLEAIHTKLVTLAQECVRVINMQPGCAFIVLRGKLPNKGWPRGKCCGSDSKGSFYWYDAQKVLAAIVAMGVVEVDTRVTK